MYKLPPDETSLPPSVRKNNTPTITDASIVIISVIERFSNTEPFVLITLERNSNNRCCYYGNKTKIEGIAG